MKKYGYEIKEGKHIAFKAENQKRFTRAKTIGENYTEERIKERIRDRLLGNDELEDIIDVRDENIKEKMQSSIAYDRAITRQNMKIASQTINELNKLGYSLGADLESELKTISFDLNERRKVLSSLDTEKIRTRDIIADVEILLAKKSHYDGYKKNPKDKIYMLMNGKDVELYKASYEQVDLFLKQFPHLKKSININKIDGKTVSKLEKHLAKIHKEQKDLYADYNDVLEKYEKIEKIKNNLDTYLGKNRKIEKKKTWVESIKNLPNQDENREREKKTKKKSRNEVEL